MKLKALAAAAIVVLCVVAALSFANCGGDEGCPGIVCSDCGASGDCDVTCTGDQVEYCGHFGLFEDQSLRCAFCESPDFEF